ncbi:MAG TPA: CoA-transferase [Candidatus Deferrimicrobium sp.]|nr:CoA-transferase [Candidatus Deferrimicrobium sp.]
MEKIYAKQGEYKVNDLLAVAAAREVTDGEVVFAGTGLPMLAMMLSQKTNAPNSFLIYEAGTIDGKSIHLPASVGDARCAYQASIGSGLYDVFSQLQRGHVDLAFLGGAEIDQYGNVNTTIIGDYTKPSVRFPGSGGNPDINSLARRTVFMMVQEKRRFKKNVDYITSPGWRIPKWPGGEIVSRQEAFGKKFRGGPSAVITNMAVFRFNEETGLMYLDTVHPGYTVEDVQNNVDFDLDVSRVSGQTEPPTLEELRLLYHEVDAEGIFLP